ncbi:methyl-accepting chemotaxis protein [Pelomonas sp. Root1217]|uniref:methyl-accepting chemotaxis protein n=1 Tax=Pelomonas sp. Root1217 TaxID=1736430 RepID=UPI0026F442F5|nr:methyl-accepting chemotaxis protein [Pelomonas sp. Root1217]
MSQLRIGPRLAVGFGLLLVLLIAMGGLAAKQTGVIYDALDYYTVNTTPSLESVRVWESRSDRIRMLQAQHILTSSDSEMAALEAAIQKATEELTRAVAGYEKLLSNDEDKRLWQDVIATTNAYVVGWADLKAISRQTAGNPAKTEEARQLFVGKGEALHKAAAAAIDKEWEFNVKLAKQLADEGAVTYRHALLAIAIACSIAVAIGIGAALLIARSIAKPVQEAVVVARTVASGDLTSRVDAQGRDETAQLLQALGQMNDSLSTIVGEVRESSESIATGSGQIASGSADLSQRTEEQAASLQQAASSMEQLSSTVQHNAESARQAHQLAREAADSAARGGDVVGHVVATMQGIAESSKRITDIIGVIDGIAFQTNILALNAAVEAARAGEGGRGFAVVAGEVRLLAQRSAIAAKEIKTLIGDSADKVEAGTRQVGAAGQSMTEIVAQIQRVGLLIGEISNATAEQSSGIAQVGTAVGQLDHVTQQNAALVEESAAAAESLRLQAARLAELVRSFKLNPQAA